MVIVAKQLSLGFVCLCSQLQTLVELEGADFEAGASFLDGNLSVYRKVKLS